VCRRVLLVSSRAPLEASNCMYALAVRTMTPSAVTQSSGLFHHVDAWWRRQLGQAAHQSTHPGRRLSICVMELQFRACNPPKFLPCSTLPSVALNGERGVARPDASIKEMRNYRQPPGVRGRGTPGRGWVGGCWVWQWSSRWLRAARNDDIEAGSWLHLAPSNLTMHPSPRSRWATNPS